MKGLEASKAALWIIDVQERLLPKVDRPQELLSALSLLIEASSLLDLPCLVSEQLPEKLGKTDRAVDAHLAKSALCYSKTTFSGMRSAELKQAVERLNRPQWILAGIETHICLLLTAFDLMREGYEVVVIAEATSSRNRRCSERALQELAQAGVRVTSLESLLYELTGDARHPQFGKILSLVKSQEPPL